MDGTMVSRDEAIIYSGSIRLSYDVRVYAGGEEFIDIYLPQTLATPEILSWQEEM